MAELHEDDFFHIYSQESLSEDWERLPKTESPERHSSDDEGEDEEILPDLEHEKSLDLDSDVNLEGRWSPERGYDADDDVTIVAYVTKQLTRNGIDCGSIKPGDFTVKKRRVLFNAGFPVCLQSLAFKDAAQMTYDLDIEEMRDKLIFLGRKRMVAIVHADGRLVVDAKNASLKDACDLMVEFYILMRDSADVQN